MVAEVKGIKCPADSWTEVSVGKVSVLILVRGLGDGRVLTGSAKPTQPPGDDYLTLSDTKPVSLTFLDATTNVYVWPASANLAVEVVRE